MLKKATVDPTSEEEVLEISPKGLLLDPVVDNDSVKKCKVWAEKLASKDNLVNPSEVDSLTGLTDYLPEMVAALEKRMVQSEGIKYSDDDIDYIQDICKKEGITFIQAEGEAEGLCVQLVSDDRCDVVLSTDGDVLVHAALSDLEEFAWFSNYNRGVVDIIYLTDVLKLVNLDHYSFAKMCIFCGCDYNTPIPRLGIKTLEKIFQSGKEPEVGMRVRGRTQLLTEEEVEMINLHRCIDLFSEKQLIEYEIDGTIAPEILGESQTSLAPPPPEDSVVILV
jgi:5'-3' exonuclease